jgi:hypothetical protein
VYAIYCKFGRSNCIITNFGLVIENQNGLVLEVEHCCIIGIIATGDRSAKIKWMEGKETFDLAFRCNDAKYVASEYKIIRDRYDKLCVAACMMILEQHGVKTDGFFV